MSRLDVVLWVTGYLINTALAIVLVRQRRYKQHLWFCTWIFMSLISNTALMIANQFGSPKVYSYTFLSFEDVDCLLQIAVLFEFARISLTDRRGWLPHLKLYLAVGFVAAGALAIFFASFVKIPGATQVDKYFACVSLFTSVFLCLLSVFVLGLSYANGFLNTALDRRRFFGFLGWALVSLAADTLHAYWRTARFYNLLETFSVAGVQLVLLFWLSVYIHAAEYSARPSARRGMLFRSYIGIV